MIMTLLDTMIMTLSLSIGYNDNDIIRPLCINLPQMTVYFRKFKGNATISFKINDKQLLKKYNQLWKTKN